MFILNVTTKVNWSIHEDWVKWLKETHTPEVKATGCFTAYKILRLLEIDEEEGPTYVVQYFAEDKSAYNRYITIHAAKMRQHAIDKWGNNFIDFRTFMEIVQ